MKKLLLVAFLATTGCATTKARPDGATGDSVRIAKVCVYNGLVAWMRSGLFWDIGGLCNENDQTLKEDL